MEIIDVVLTVVTNPIAWALASPKRRPIGTIVFFTLVGLILLVLRGWLWGEDRTWWASAGQWVGGVGSIEAAAVALWVAYRSWQQADRERRDDEIVQARLVIVHQVIGSPQGMRVLFFNRSDSFLMDIGLESISRPEGAGPGKWLVHESYASSPGKRYDPPHPLPMTPFSRVKDNHIFSMYLRYVLDQDGTPVTVAKRPDVFKFHYTDDHGRQWSRVNDDEPVRVTTPRPRHWIVRDS